MYQILRRAFITLSSSLIPTDQQDPELPHVDSIKSYNFGPLTAVGSEGVGSWERVAEAASMMAAPVLNGLKKVWPLSQSYSTFIGPSYI